MKKRYGVGAGLFFHKPSSPRYQFAKHGLDATARTQLTTVLKFQIAQAAAPGVNVNELVELYLCVQHARLRIHTPEERSKVRRDHLIRGVTGTAHTAVWAGVTFGAAAPAVMIQAIQDGRNIHRNYYRSEARPEYATSFNDMMGMLRAEQVPPAAKRMIAATVLDQFIGSEKLLTPLDANRILLAVNAGQVPDQTRYWERRMGDYQRMARGILRAPSTVRQQDRLIEWATTEGLSSDHLSMERFNSAREQQLRRRAEVYDNIRVDVDLNKIYRHINVFRTTEGLTALKVPQNLDKWNNAKNAKAFTYLLTRADKDAANLLKNRKREVYQNVALILEAIEMEESFAEQLFSASVGGERHCINNAMEYISDLASKSKNRGLVRKIESGELNAQQFTEICMQNFRLDVLEQYIATSILPHAIKENQWIEGQYEPELGQRIKSDLRQEAKLALPDTVNPSSASYPGQSVMHKRFLAAATEHVINFTENKTYQQAFLETDPLWREGVIALAKKNQRSKDLASLESFTLNLDKFVEHDGTIFGPNSKIIEDNGLCAAVMASNDLTELYRPKTGQKVWAADGKKKDKYKTENPAYQEIYDQIEAWEYKFEESLQSLKRQFTSYMTGSLTGENADLPEDGKFKPQFVLPKGWDKGMQSLITLSKSAEIGELSNALQNHEQTVKELTKAIRKFDDSHRFSGAVPYNTLGELKQVMQKSYARPGMERDLFNLQIYRANTPEGENEIPSVLIDMRNTMMELAKTKKASALSRKRLEELSPTILKEAEALLKNDIDNFTHYYSKYFIDVEEFFRIRKLIEQFYAQPENRFKEYDLKQYAVKNPVTKRKEAGALVELRNKIQHLALTQHEHAVTIMRLKEIGISSVDVSGDNAPFLSSAISQLPDYYNIAAQIDPRARDAILLLDKAFSSGQFLVDVSVADFEATREKNKEFDSRQETVKETKSRAFKDEFDVTAGAPTQQYVERMAENVKEARISLTQSGLETGYASAAGNNCMIHSILDGIGITGELNIALAAELREDLARRLAEHGEVLMPDAYLDTFGSHPAHLIDVINERFSSANIGMRIYTPLPNGGLLFVNQDSAGGTGHTARENMVAVMWVGNHYEPIKVKDVGRDESLALD